MSYLNIKRSTGVDNISDKHLKSCSNSFSHAVSGLVTLSFATNTFPSSLKEAQVLPLFKKKDPLKKENYVPVSVLHTTSKVYERTVHDQLTEHCDIFLILTCCFQERFWMPDYSAASPAGLASGLG